jgi:hypothetical protein
VTSKGERNERAFRTARRLSLAGLIPAAGPASGGLIVVVGGWTGGLASALRAALRDTIDEYAVRLGVGVSTAGDWESNPDVVPHAVNQRALDTTLYRADDECKRRFDLLTRGNRHVLVSDLARLNGNGVVTHRRDATTAAAGLVTAFTPMEALERIAVQNEYPIDAGLVAAHEKFADALAELGPITTRLDLICE